MYLSLPIYILLPMLPKKLPGLLKKCVSTRVIMQIKSVLKILNTPALNIRLNWKEYTRNLLPW